MSSLSPACTACSALLELVTTPYSSMHELCKAVKVLVLDGSIATKEKCKNATVVGKNATKGKKGEENRKKKRHLEMYYLRSGNLFSPYNSF